MVGDDRVRACGGCDRPVFNLSAMSREEAERVLAARGLTRACGSIVGPTAR